MRPSGIIYQSNKSERAGEVRLSVGLGRRIAFHLLRGFGAGLIAFAFVGMFFTFWPVLNAELSYRFITQKSSTSKFGYILDQVRAENSQAITEETGVLGVDPYFSIYIPKIDAHENVIPNVDAGNPNEYLTALEDGVAHAKGTNFPGSGKTVYLFSHSTDSPLNFARYNAVFYLLGKLDKGDRIVVYFVGRKFVYEVTDKLVTTAGDTSWLVDDGSGERLVLQTCDPPGTSWRRLIIIARVQIFW